MNRMFRRACGALLSCVCVIWHSRLDADAGKTCQIWAYSGRRAQDVTLSSGYTQWYVGYDVAGVWENESRSHFYNCIKAKSDHKFQVCSIPMLGAYAAGGTTFEKRCLLPYTETFGNTGCAIPFSCMINKDNAKIVYAATPQMFKAYGCTEGTVGSSATKCLYTLTPNDSSSGYITFYPLGKAAAGSGGSGSSNQTGIAVSGMMVPYLKYSFTGCHHDGYWNGTAMPSNGDGFTFYAHPSKKQSKATSDSLEAAIGSMLENCSTPDGYFFDDGGHYLTSGTSSVSIGTDDVDNIIGCQYCPTGASDLTNKSTLYGSKTPYLSVKQQAGRIGISSCSLNYVSGPDANGKGTIKYTKCTSYK